MNRTLAIVLLAAVASSMPEIAIAQVATEVWADRDRVERRTCPSIECGIVGELFFREVAQVLEERDGWIRITKFYDGSCVGGRSEYVDSGNAACTVDNGFDGNEFAEWVPNDVMTAARPADPAADAAGSAALIAGSDDFRVHQAAFVAAAEKLIADRTCTAKNFTDNGGWVKSMNNKSEPVYFMYCGSGGSDRIYLNASTGGTYR